MPLSHPTKRAPRRLAALLSLIAAAFALTGCLVSDKLVDLGPRARPLPAGLYVSFDDKGSPEHAVVVRLTKDGRYDGEDFSLTLYESDIEPDLYFAAHYDDKEDKYLYGLAIAEADALVYPGVTCRSVPEPERALLPQHDDGCAITSAEQGRAALAAIWRAIPKKEREAREGWTRFVRQQELRR